MNIQLVNLSDEEYIELKTDFIKSKEKNWKSFFLRAVRAWKTQKQ